MANFVSGYATDPMAGFSSRARDLLRHSYVKPKVKSFFEKRGIRNYHRISPGRALAAESDYATPGNGGVDFSYFYDILLSDIQKREGRIDYVAYTLTLDEALTDEGRCERSGLHYGNALLGEEPFFYYLRLDMQEMIQRIREDEFPDLPVEY